MSSDGYRIVSGRSQRLKQQVSGQQVKMIPILYKNVRYGFGPWELSMKIKV